MCGIAGFIDLRLAEKPEALRIQADAMNLAIRHRGPDGDGIFVEPGLGLALTHRRLSIVDLSPAGAQPMTSASGRFVLCYNGEVYNAEDMRRDPALSSVNWRGHSDTEVILEYAAVYGLERMLQEANGMFALALWDRRDKVLHLARDRLGIKPLFVADLQQGLAFASELKAIQHVSGFDADVDPAAVASFLRFAYVPAPLSIYRKVQKLLPGCVLTLPIDDLRKGRAHRVERYWSLRTVAQAGTQSPTTLSEDEATEHLESLLGDAVKRQLMSEVPLGALLSGGVDSSAIVAMMIQAAGQTVRTFSIGFEDSEFDESRHAAAIARHLGTHHTELRVTPQAALDVIPRLPQIYDEPFADSSQIPTFLVSKLTKAHVTVALSGDGGDELFGGYNRHRFAAGLGARLERLPLSLRRAAGAALAAAPEWTISFASSVLPPRMRSAQAADKLRKLARVLPLDEEAAYLALISQIDNLKEIAPKLDALPRAAQDQPHFSDMLRNMQYRDMQGYLPDDILHKVDRASMAVGLEVRPPFLDHRLVEFAWRLPADFKVRRGETKWLLRRVLARHVPDELLNRPKMGFGIPLADWLRGPLSDWASDTLASEGIWSNFIDRAAAQRLWKRHRDREENLAYAIWPILTLASWKPTVAPS